MRNRVTGRHKIIKTTSTAFISGFYIPEVPRLTFQNDFKIITLFFRKSNKMKFRGKPNL